MGHEVLEKLCLFSSILCVESYLKLRWIVWIKTAMTMVFRSKIFNALVVRIGFGILCFGYSCFGKPDALRVALSVEIENLDPQLSTSIDSIKVQCALFETLVGVDSESGRVVPLSAKSWEISNDGRTYKFSLREDLKWSDGTSIVADDYLFAMQRLLHGELAAPFADLYLCIKGARAYREEDTAFSSVAVKATDEQTLEITLERPVPYFLSLMARPCTAALPESFLKKSGNFYDRNSDWASVPGFPCSGPFVLSEWVVNKWIKLKRNPYYWNGKELQFEEVVFYPMESVYAQEQGILVDLLDVNSKIATDRVMTYFNSPMYQRQDEMGTFYIITNCNEGSGAAAFSVNERRILFNEVNREVITGNLRGRGESPAVRFVPPLWQDYQNLISKEVQSEAERPGEGSIAGKFRLLISSSETNRAIAEAVQSMWEGRLGIKIEIVQQEWKSYLDSRNRGDFDLCLATWIGDYPDPLTFLEMWTSGHTNNFAKWSDPRYDELVEESHLETDSEKRFALLAKAENRLLNQAAIIPLFFLNRVYLKSDRIGRWPQSVLNTVDYTKVTRK